MKMANLTQVLGQLRDERNAVAKELDRLDKAIAAVSKLLSGSSAPATTKKKTAGRRRRLSAAARKRISDAQKARWAKTRKQQKEA